MFTKTMLAAVDTGEYNIDDSIKELTALCEAAELEVIFSIVQKRDNPENKYYLGEGKLEEAKQLADANEIELCVFDCELTGSQIRNISDYLGIEVIDRTMLILEIFSRRATTSEGKLQTELALLKYRLPRLSGVGVSMSRQGGGGGGGGGARRGGGETKLELDRRYIQGRIDLIKQKLAQVEKRRDLLNTRRKKNDVPIVALTGYTNVGKSSLLNALTGSDIFEKDMLFATLDPTARKLVLPSGQTVILVDTVGFVSRLPHKLVEAFKSTLEQAKYADIILRICTDYKNRYPNTNGKLSLAINRALETLDKYSNYILGMGYMLHAEDMPILKEYIESLIGQETAFGDDMLAATAEYLTEMENKW